MEDLMNFFNAVLPIVLFFAILFLLVFIRKKKGIRKIQYDERQNAIQGTCYRYAAITGILGGIIVSLLIEANLLPVSGGFAMMSVSLLTGLVYVVSMILKGAYFGISGHWKKWTACILIIGLCNFCISVRYIAANGLTDGRLTLDDINLPLGIAFLVIAAAVFFQKARESREDNR
jgi:hypothetical protein